MKPTIIVSLIVFGLVLASCNENDAPSATTVALEMKATTSLSKISKSGRSMNTGLVFREVLAGVTELEFETLEENQEEAEQDSIDGEDHDGEDENEEIEFEGHFIVDLVNGTSTPDFGVADIVPGTYEEIEMEIGPILPDGNSLFVAFELPQQGADTLIVEFSTTNEAELEIEDDAGFQIDGNSLTQILVMVDLDALFAGIDLSDAMPDPDGVIRINSTSNPHLAQLIEDNLEHALEAGEDDDEDGEIDED